MRDDALRHLASAPVDVLFTDINLPGGMDGAALARRARDMHARAAGVVYASGAERCSMRKSACPARSSCPSRMCRRSSGASC